MSIANMTQPHPETFAPATVIPRLESGDLLSRAEFERRYHAMPNCKKAELIEGIVYMPSPVSHDNHGKPHALLMTWLGVYQSATPGVDFSDNPTVRLDLNNVPQPDAVLFIQPECGGAVKMQDCYIEGSPELVAEVAASSVSIDMHAKRRVYLRNGVKEYIVWRVLEGELDWFVLRDSEYALLTPDAAGILRSEHFPGLWLHRTALLARNMAQVLETLSLGLQDASHERFKASLIPAR